MIWLDFWFDVAQGLMGREKWGMGEFGVGNAPGFRMSDCGLRRPGIWDVGHIHVLVGVLLERAPHRGRRGQNVLGGPRGEASGRGGIMILTAVRIRSKRRDIRGSEVLFLAPAYRRRSPHGLTQALKTSRPQSASFSPDPPTMALVSTAPQTVASLTESELGALK